MTTNELEGRALAEAAARAMGWTDLRIERLSRYRSGITGGGGMPSEPVECLVGNPPNGSSPPPMIRHVNITVDECLAWLHERGFLHTFSGSGKCHATIVGTCGSRDDAGGANLLEALQRLVVAVAAREVKQ